MTKRNLIFILLGIISISIIWISYKMYGYAKGIEQDSAKNKMLNQKSFGIESGQEKNKIHNGFWVNSKDSLAIVEIKNYKWTFTYKGEPTDSTDVYDYQIVNELKENGKYLKGEFLVLTNSSDTLKYVLDYLTEKNLTLIYFPRGNFHHYYRKE